MENDSALLARFVDPVQFPSRRRQGLGDLSQETASATGGVSLRHHTGGQVHSSSSTLARTLKMCSVTDFTPATKHQCIVDPNCLWAGMESAELPTRGRALIRSCSLLSSETCDEQAPKLQRSNTVQMGALSGPAYGRVTRTRAASVGARKPRARHDAHEFEESTGTACHGDHLAVAGSSFKRDFLLCCPCLVLFVVGFALNKGCKSQLNF